jgi:hypothetical protein
MSFKIAIAVIGMLTFALCGEARADQRVCVAINQPGLSLVEVCLVAGNGTEDCVARGFAIASKVEKIYTLPTSLSSFWFGWDVVAVYDVWATGEELELWRRGDGRLTRRWTRYRAPRFHGACGSPL